LSLVRSATAVAAGGVTLAHSPVPPVVEGQAFAVARMVRGILSYTRWPDPSAAIRLCVAGAPLYATRLADVDSAAGRIIRIRPLTSGEGPTAVGCDGLYLGTLPASARSQLLAEAHGRATVTIDEDDPECRAGAMFCLAVTPSRLTFQLNLDAVSRGTVRIDPKVLLLSRGREAQP